MARRVFLPVSELLNGGVDKYKLVDVRVSLLDRSWGRSEHVKLRPKNSVFADLDHDLADPAAPEKGRHPLPEVKRFASWCSKWGVDGRKPVLAFDAEGGALAASRLWWMLTTVGVEAHVLDGGWGAYLAANLPTDSGEPVLPEPVSVSFPDDAWTKVTASETEVTHARENGVPLLDARPPARFGSTIRPAGPDPLPSHVPGAVNAPFPANFVTDDPLKHLKSDSELRAHWDHVLAKAGGDPANRIFMCGSGVTACHGIAVMTHLGHPKPRLYVGSWSQWANLHKEEVERRVLQEHGVLLKIITAAPNQPPAEIGKNCRVKLNGEDATGSALPDAVTRALGAMHVGEKASVITVDGPLFDVEVLPL